MGSLQNKIKEFERYYGVHLRSLSRSRRFMTLLLITICFMILTGYLLLPRNKKSGSFSAELESFIDSKLDRYKESIKSFNTLITVWPVKEKDPLVETQNTDKNELDHHDENLFLPYTGNGYIGISIISKRGIFANHHKTLSLPLLYNPLSQIYSDSMAKKEVTYVDVLNGLVGKIQCYQDKQDCIEISNTVYAHRTRPSILIEEIVLNNPTKESITFDVIQMGAKNWNLSSIKTENFNNMEFTVTKGIIDVSIDGKLKHLCISIGSTKLPNNLRIQEHEFNTKHYVITVIKYSVTLLTGKIEHLEPILNDLENQVVIELREATGIGFKQLKIEHTKAWNDIWKSGFGISKSLADDALNGDRVNASLYYIASNQRAPLIEKSKPISNSSITEFKNEYHIERCYEGFSTLNAVKLWKLPLDENEIADLNSLWMLTLQKHGCKSLLEMGVNGVLQAVVLSLGGLKFTLHHLETNLNPRQIHRDYYFRKINYANLSFISIEIIVDSDNHARLYVTLDELIDKNQKFYACDAGCIDPPVFLKNNEKIEFPVKLTNPLTAILYISPDKSHIDELQHALHVQEIDIAPQQDAHSIAIHKHGHSLGGLAALFWTLFVILIIIFHLFLFKLIYRELCAFSNNVPNEKSSYGGYGKNDYRKGRYARTV
ncbi:unnamed protein product [Brachionus calyciflorus]|uniref:Uncharacterized protein n=2 Tax=Brachionus calyciflorus TaxID=104777 RepID=A0A814CW52_9BILA|nr:unnamed protein product [Brachionus calyciflorus]